MQVNATCETISLLLAERETSSFLIRFVGFDRITSNVARGKEECESTLQLAGRCRYIVRSVLNKRDQDYASENETKEYTPMLYGFY